MVKKTIVTIIAFTFIILLTSSTSYAQGISFSLNGGISKAVGEGSEDWKFGISFGGNGFFPVSPNMLIGGRIAYNRWTPDVTRWEENESWAEWEASGSATIIEIIPSIRLLAPFSETRSTNFFGQAGFGLFLLNMDAKITGTSEGSKFYATFADQSESKTGISLGGGLSLGKRRSKRFEFLVLYHIIFTEEESTKYYSI